MSVILNLIVFIVVLSIIIAFHEFGHFLLAKLNGVYVYEYAIGMGPKLLSKKKGETTYSLRAIPIGGFCQLAGEDLETDDDRKIPKERRLQNKKAWQRFLIMVFGPVNNFILAVLILFLIGIIWGGATMAPVINTVEDNSAAYEAGIEAGDTVLEINGHEIETSDDISLFLAISDPKKGSLFKVEKSNDIYKTIKVVPKRIEEEDTYRYGIGIKQEETKGLGNAFVYTWKKTKSIFKQMFVTVGCLFTGKVKLTQLSGPVGIYSVVGQSRSAGVVSVLTLMALLSINVGFINLLPIPAFDGGHILFIIIEYLKGSPINPEVENKIHAVFLILLMILMLFITFNDILRLF